MLSAHHSHSHIDTEHSTSSLYYSDEKLLGSVVVILGSFLAEKLSNTRYLALEAMTKFAQVSPDAATLLQQHMKTVIEALEDPDISIRRVRIKLPLHTANDGL
jgi:hypothetical protein